MYVKLSNSYTYSSSQSCSFYLPLSLRLILFVSLCSSELVHNVTTNNYFSLPPSRLFSYSLSSTFCISPSPSFSRSLSLSASLSLYLFPNLLYLTLPVYPASSLFLRLFASLPARRFMYPSVSLFVCLSSMWLSV